MTVIDNLNDKQRTSVLSEARRILVLAGAGSGKTKTLISKVLHLIKEKGVKPSSILAITFTRNATNEMIDRLIISADKTGTYEKLIGNKKLSVKDKEKERHRHSNEQPWIHNLTVKTFHSLCYQILRENGNPVFDSKFKLILDEASNELELDGKDFIAAEKPKDIIHKILIEVCKNREYILKLKRYILDYYVDRTFFAKEMPRHSNEGQITYTTLKGEIVKSKSERDIADWLYRHNITYNYEKEMNLKDFSFKPDFYVPQADLFLEHVSDKSFPMQDKETQFKEAGRNCVITYESMMNNTNLFNLAMERIIMGKLTSSLTEEVTLNFDEEFKSYHSKIYEFLKTVSRLQTMLKSEDIEASGLIAKTRQHKHERIRVFYELAIPLIQNYSAYCTNKSYVDFDDLIILAIKLLREHPEVRAIYQEKYKHVLVDEFQDVNGLQVKLLDLMLKPENQLFCVGDDWQSIYGFRGSNVEYILNFEKHYLDSEIHKLDVNYRSSSSIVKASNEVIKHNKHQIAKEIDAHKKAPSTIQIFRAHHLEYDGVDFLVDKVKELYQRGLGKEDILVLYRRTKMFTPYFERLKANELYVSHKTIHSAKGLEAKVVFILGLTYGSGGFPDIWLDDEIFRVVKDVKFDILLEEERRLFYVALTRAKDELYLITEQGNESQFVDEIPEQYYSYNGANSISEPEVPYPQIGSTDSSVRRVCVGCQTSIDASFKFCPHCGKSQSVAEVTQATENKKSYSVVGKRLQHKNAYAPWSSQDDAKLEELFCKKTSVSEMSVYFGRNTGAIHSRIKKLELDLKYRD